MCRRLHDKLKIELYVHKYYRITAALFLASGVFAGLFVLGLHYTRDRDDPASNIPYFFPAMVSGSFCFLECLATLLMCREGRVMTKHGQHLGKGGFARRRYTKIDGVYYLLRLIGFIFGFIGMIFTTYGFCINEDNCYYDVNMTENRIITGFAVLAQILFMFGQFYLLFWVKADIYPFAKSSRIKPAPRPNPNTSSNASGLLKKDDDNPTVIISLKKTNEDKGNVNKPAKPPLTKTTSLFEIKAIDSKGGRDVKPSPQPKKLNYPDGRDQLLADIQRFNGFGSKEQGKTLFSGDRARHEASADILLRHYGDPTGDVTLRHYGDKPPPPSYEDVMVGTSRVKRKPSDLGPSPYHLPPIPGYDDDAYQVPDNIYTSGSSYPDEELIAIQPKNV